MTLVKKILYTIKLISNGLGIISGIILILMMTQTATDVISNNFFGRPIDGNVEIMTIYYMTSLAFLPIALAEIRHEHIRTDFVYRYFGKKLKKLAYLLGSLLSIMFFLILAYQTLLDAMKSYAISERLMGGVYLWVWPAKWALPIAFLMAAAAVFATTIEYICFGSSNDDES